MFVIISQLLGPRHSKTLLGEFGGTAGTRPGPRACGRQAESTRGWNLVSGATQTAGSIP